MLKEMKNVTFKNDTKKIWKEFKYKQISIWIAGYDKTNIFNVLTKHFGSEKSINLTRIKVILNNLDGNFSIVCIAKNFVFAAVDCIRSYPLFWSKIGNKIIISSNSNNILSDKNIVDKDQLLAFRMSGYTIDEGSLWRNVYNIKAGNFIFIDNKFDVFKARFFLYDPWHEKKIPDHILKKNLKKEIFKLLKNVIKKANGRNIVIPLSAGLDSRLIVSGLKYLNYDKVKCFSYGLKNNFESVAAKKIAKHLGYSWEYVEINQKTAKKFYRSELHQNFLINTIDGCSTPSIQGFYAINKLLKNKYITQNDIIINGNSGDFISGGHLPKFEKNELKNLKIKLLDKLLEKHISKHYCLWEKLVNNENTDKIISLLKKQIQKEKLLFDNKSIKVGIYEFLEYENRQTKYVVNCQRIYDFFNLDWMLPLWDKSFIKFWKNVPYDKKLNQNLYKSVLLELNMGGVWSKQFNIKPYVSPIWVKLIRFPLKCIFFFLGKNKWYKFEKKFIDYWTCNVCGQSKFKYFDVIKNQNGARHYVSWYTLLSENLIFKKNWQKLKIK